MDLNQLRQEIDAIDSELLSLFLRRMSLSDEVAGYKIQNGLPVFHPQREREILESVRQKAGPAMGDYAEKFFTSILSLSRELQETLIAKGKS